MTEKQWLGQRMASHLAVIWFGDVFEVFNQLVSSGLAPDAAVYHPTCTYLTASAEWAYKPGPYHQKVKPGTLVGEARVQARQKAMDEFERLLALPIDLKIIENPVGVLSRIRKPNQIIQPFEFGDDASKKTCLWYAGRNGERLNCSLPIDPNKRVKGRIVDGKERFANQTDGGWNRLSPSDDRWKERSRTYPGIADAITEMVIRNFNNGK